MKELFTVEEGMVGVRFGKWLGGLDWSRGWKGSYLFLFDLDSDGDVWRSRW